MQRWRINNLALIKVVGKNKGVGHGGCHEPSNLETLMTGEKDGGE